MAIKSGMVRRPVLRGLVCGLVGGFLCMIGAEVRLAYAQTQDSGASMAQDYYEQGRKFGAAKQYPEAIDAFKKALALAPSNLLAQYELGCTYNDAGDYRSAIGLLKQMLNEDLSSVNQLKVSVLNQIAIAYFEMEQYPDAVAFFKQALLVKPDHADSRFELGLTYVLMGKKEDALQAYRTLVPLDNAKAQQLLETINSTKWDAPPPPNAADAQWTLGEKYRDTKDYAKAIEAYKKVIALAPGSPHAADAYHGMGWIDLEQKDYHAAVTDLGEALRLSPNDAEVNFELGQAFLYNGVKPRAIELFKQAIRLQPDHTDAYYYLGLTYDMMNDKLSALQIYEKLKPIDKDAAQALYEQIQKSK